MTPETQAPARPSVPVDVTNAEPLPVVITNAVQDDPRPLDVHVTNPTHGPIGPQVQQQATDPSLPARTTFQQDLTHAGQRQINLIWESTQGRIALYVIVGAMGINALVLVISIALSKDLTAAQALALGFVNSLATGVTSFYFSRTNHTQIGGTGDKPSEAYVGR
jgi:hypothetical protein